MLENARLQDAVHESEENYRAVVDSANDAIVINQHGKRVFVNKAFLTIHGLENMSQAIGQPIT